MGHSTFVRRRVWTPARRQPGSSRLRKSKQIGIHIVHADTAFFTGDILIHNNETCNATQFAPSGASLWDVTDPTDPEPLTLNLDGEPVQSRHFRIDSVPGRVRMHLPPGSPLLA